MSITVDSVSKMYGAQKALDNVSFSIGDQEVVGFLGPNGAGKSTMMKIISCFIPPTSGKIDVCGFDTASQSMDVRRNVGYLPESNPLYYDMYVKEYLAFVAAIYGIPNVEARIQEMIDQTGLQVEQHKQIGQLSKGYKQRVGLAQAMLHNPKVLILDEPTSGLDPNQLVGIRQLIKQLGQHKTVLFSSHIMQEVEAVCDRIIIIDKGKIVADQKTSEVGKSLQGRQSVVVEFDKEIDVKMLRSLPSVQSVKKLDGLNYSVSSHGSDDLRKMVAEWAQQNNVLVLSLRKEDDKLESVFHRLTGQGN